jgi:hypothetical protein
MLYESWFTAEDLRVMDLDSDDSGSIGWEDSNISDYPCNKPIWVPLDGEQRAKELVEKLELLFPSVIALSSDQSTAGFTLLHQIGRNFLLYCRDGRWERVIDESHEDSRWTCEEVPPECNLRAYLDKSHNSEQLSAFIRDKFGSVPMENFKMRRVGAAATDYHRLAYYGLFASMMMRAIAKKEKDLKYLYLKGGLSKSYRQFYGMKPPYYEIGTAVLDPFISSSIMTTNRLRALEAKTFLFFSCRAISILGSDDKERIKLLEDSFMGELMLLHLTTVKWVQQASESAEMPPMELAKLLQIRDALPERALENLEKYYDGQSTYFRIARVLNTDYLKDLGRKNESAVLICYLICYYYADAAERSRLRNYVFPCDPFKGGLSDFVTVLICIEETKARDNGMNFSEVNRSELARKCDEIYKESGVAGTNSI